MAMVHPNLLRNVSSAPLEDIQLYDDWLMELVIKHGIGQPIAHYTTTWGKLSAAEAIGHVAIVNHETVVTPKAKQYLEMIANMEERVT